MADWFDQNPYAEPGIEAGPRRQTRDPNAPGYDPGFAGPIQPGPLQPETGLQQGGGDWITQALQSVQSTDDPAYWQKVIAEHGDTNNPQAQAYWIDRIRRGDGSALVKSGQLSPVSDGGGGNGISSGSLLAPWTKDFAAPSAQDALNSPGLQFAMQQAQQALQRSAAARGTALSSGTLADLQNNAIGMSLQGYGDVYNRARDQYLIGRDNFYANQDRPYSKLSGLASLGENAAAQTGNFGSQFANNGSEAYYGAGNAQAAGAIANGNTNAGVVGGLANLGGQIYQQYAGRNGQQIYGPGY